MVILIGLYIVYKKRKNIRKKNSKKDNSETPEWIRKVKEKERK